MKTFSERVYDLLRKVPQGRVTTYKELAHALGTKAYRGVGQAMRRNSHAPEVPWHRVVAASGRIGGFQGKLSGDALRKKVQLLKDEGIEFQGEKIKNFEEVFFRFPWWANLTRWDIREISTLEPETRKEMEKPGLSVVDVAINAFSGNW